MRFLFIVNDSWFFKSHRLPLAQKLILEGYSVHLVSRSDHTVRDLESFGIKCHKWLIKPRSTSPISELISFLSLVYHVLRIRPQCIHLVTIKPVLYGGIIARIFQIYAVVYSVSGLGSIYRSDSFKSRIISKLLRRFHRFALCHPNSVILFQNPDDQKRLIKDLSLNNSSTTIIRGSGVDLNRYKVTSEPKGQLIVVMATRILRDKGVAEFIEAADIVANSCNNTKFILAGELSAQGNPGAFSEEEFHELVEGSSVLYKGKCDDIAQLFSSAAIVVLPSYHEGLPKVLCEAAACGRPVVTTDVPGCAFAIEPNKTGLLVKKGDSSDLAQTILNLLRDDSLRRSMGKQGRILAEKEFSIDSVVEKHYSIYKELINSRL